MSKQEPLSWELSLFKDKTEEDFDVLYQWDDPSLSYEFDLITILRDKADGAIYIAQTSGCSCPSYEEVAELTFGPGTVDGAIAVFQTGNYKGCTYSNEAEMVLAVEKARDS